MTLQECYERIGGDYSDALKRLSMDKLISRFLLMYLDDPGFNDLTAALDAGDTETAFRAAHTMKGVCANLSLAKLAASSSEITELLRAGNLEEAKAYFPTVRADHEAAISAISEYKASL